MNDICLYKFKNYLFLILKNSYYRINNSDEINVRIEVSHGFWGDEKNRNEYISEKT